MKQNKQTNINEPWWDFTIPPFILNLLTQLSAKKYSFSTVLFIIIIVALIVNQLLLVKVNSDIPSAHDHADFKVYINGAALNFADPEYFMKSAFIHVDNNQNQEDAGGVLHMHAKNTPLWLFFRSLGMQLENDSLKTADGQILKNENGNTLKFYLNGKKVDGLGNYSFQPLDKILISYGPENDPDIQKQINSVTNFAKDHQK